MAVVENGRSGTVIYHDPAGQLSFPWEFGGGDVVAIVSMGSKEEWAGSYAWALDRRTSIMRFVAGEVVRQRAPSCTVEIDDLSGDVLLLQSGTKDRTAVAGATVPAPSAKAEAFVRRYSKLKMMMGVGVLGVALVIGGVFWLGKKALSVSPRNGVPLGACVRTNTHIATLIQRTDPHLPHWSGRGGNETTSISIFLIPLDGSETRMIPVASELDVNSYQLSRIMGSDGQTLWFDCGGLFGVRLSDHQLITTEDLRKANEALDPGWWKDTRGMDIVDGRLHILSDDNTAAVDVDPVSWKATPVTPKPSNARFERHEPAEFLAAGVLVAPETWIGLHSAEELDAAFKIGSWVRPVEHAEDAKRLRRLCKAQLEASSDGEHSRILSMASLGATEFLNAAFLRMDDKSGPLRLSQPDGALMIFTSEPGLNGTLMVARVDMEGHPLWKIDTAIDRFDLRQILPGERYFAFVGTRPPVPDKLSEPIVVVVDNATGAMVTHSLWQ
ncbi:MAG: hypothetical protein IT229_11515 [Flavobacteriales bacterium]|nr:hypothetical protein [Flavobacteriales bacterium]